METTSSINALADGAAQAAASKSRVVSAIKTASERSGVDFSYLLTKASQESGFNSSAKAMNSSATGLYQFIDQTWLKTLKQSGDQYGLGDVAAKITVGADGVARVASASDKKAILDLRKNPEISAEMAAELAKTNKEQLQAEVGGKIGSTELYLAHFLGAGGAADLLNAMKSNPNAKAADLLPSAAAANRSVFFDKATGESKSVAQIYQQFAKKFDGKTMETQLASLGTSSGRSAGTSSLAQAQESARAVETAAANQVLASAAGSSGSFATSSGVQIDKNTTASSFATMLLAQMDMDTFGLKASEMAANGTGRTDDERRKSVLSTLAAAG